MPADMPTAKSDDLTIDRNNLFREEVFSDRKVGTIRQLVPVSADGSADPSRSALFVGQAQIMTPMGPVPLSFEIDADSLVTAIEKFPPAMQEAVDRAVEEIREMQRQSASSIVVPGAGEGKIKLP